MFTRSLLRSRVVSRLAIRQFSKVQPSLQEIEHEDESASSILEGEMEPVTQASYFQSATSEVFKKEWNSINSIEKMNEFYNKNKENFTQVGQ